MKKTVITCGILCVVTIVIGIVLFWKPLYKKFEYMGERKKIQNTLKKTPNLDVTSDESIHYFNEIIDQLHSAETKLGTCSVLRLTVELSDNVKGELRERIIFEGQNLLSRAVAQECCNELYEAAMKWKNDEFFCSEFLTSLLELFDVSQKTSIMKKCPILIDAVVEIGKITENHHLKCIEVLSCADSSLAKEALIILKEWYEGDKEIKEWTKDAFEEAFRVIEMKESG